MRAWVYRTKGKPADVLRLEPDYPKPVPTSSQVLVRVKAAGLNPIGYKSMYVAPLKFSQKVPSVPEQDVAGVVEGGDLEGTGLKLGDEVFGLLPIQETNKTCKGALAEYTVIDKANVMRKPASLSFEETASFPLALLTAYWALVTTGKLQKGTRVFINGGSGGVGAYAVQVAKAYGAFVVTTCSPASRDLVSTLGADDVLDYRASPLPAQLKAKYGNEPFDLVFDTVGADPSVWHKCSGYLKPKGHYVDVAGPHMDGSLGSMLSGMTSFMGRMLRPGFLGGVPRKYTFGIMAADRQMVDAVEELVRAGKVRPIIDSVFAFEHALEAYDRQMSSRAQGKIVVRVEA